MQKTCLNCTHVGVCSKRMQFIVNNYATATRMSLTRWIPLSIILIP